jgi:Uncharacterised protein family UPF0547
MEGTASLKTCPECAEDVKAAARVCHFCGFRFDGGAAPAPVATQALEPPPRVAQDAELRGAFLNGESWEIGRWLVVMNDGVVISGDREASFAARWDQIEAINVDGPDTVQSRVTVPRMLLLGLLAFAIKKNESRTYVSIETSDHHVVLFGIQDVVSEVRAAIAPFMPVLAYHRATRTA